MSLMYGRSDGSSSAPTGRREVEVACTVRRCPGACGGSRCASALRVIGGGHVAPARWLTRRRRFRPRRPGG
jgi:hypothetical protein